MDGKTTKFAIDTLAELFPKAEKETTYSLGFQRWLKISKKKRTALWLIYKFDESLIKDLLQWGG